MNSETLNDLRNHLALCQEVLDLTQRENNRLRTAETGFQFEHCQARKSLVPRLSQSLTALRRHRAAWQCLPAAERAAQPEFLSLLRHNQDLIMKILVLDRENEQFLLRQGLVPARHIPPAPTQRPHFVADLYRRNRLGSGNAD